MSQTETTGANQYGFYAIPKALEPKKKYRQPSDDQYEDEDGQETQQTFTPLDREQADMRQLQRDYYVDQAPYPEFKPRERGLDCGVQIQRGDLFDFEIEVRPLLQILVGRSVVSAINELQQQREREERRRKLDEYQKKRNAQLMVTQRMQAKHMRKDQEAARRKLQKEIYTKNEKKATMKLLARKNAKQCLLGLRRESFHQLEDAGYLRADPINDLKIKYEEWLYSQIMDTLAVEAASKVEANKLLRLQEKTLIEEHSVYIKKENERRKGIIDERERVRKENEQRKEKKRIRKQRIALNQRRQPDIVRFQELLQKYEQVQSILKHPERSDGFSRGYSARDCVYVAGGIHNFVVAMLQQSGRHFEHEQIELLLRKVLTETPKLQVPLSKAHYDKLQEKYRAMHESKLQFMRAKDGIVQQLSESISLDLSLLEALNIHIKSDLHRAVLNTLIDIWLTVQPEAVEGETFEINQRNKRNLQVRERIEFVEEQETFVQRIASVEQLLRVRFLRKAEKEESQDQGEKNAQQNSNVNDKVEDEWIDIYDGEGWTRRMQQEGEKKHVSPNQQTAVSYVLGSFENSFVYDQRTLYYLQTELQKLLEIEGGQHMKKFSQDLGNLQARIKKEVAVFDSELPWE